MINTKTGQPFPRGAKPSPRHKLISAPQHRIVGRTPFFSAFIPPKLDMWGNDVDGDCVTASEAFAKACCVVNGSEIFITSQTATGWASANGYLNGADLTTVMDSMAKSGFSQGGSIYSDGPYTAVDYSNETALQNAISIAPVKIGIDADALPKTAGNQMGWYALGTTQKFTDEDHCVELCGFGQASLLFQALASVYPGVALPAGLLPTAQGYLLFTWSTIGFVDYAWIMSTVGEAWLRNYLTAVNGAVIPNPVSVQVGPSPTPTPVPPGPSPTPTPSPSPVPVPPSPTPTPTPVPVPTPGPTLQQQIDAVFAKVEQEMSRYPQVVMVLKIAQSYIDRYLTLNSLLYTRGKISGLPSIPPAVISIIDSALKEAAIEYPQYSTEILIIQTLFDKYAPSL